MLSWLSAHGNHQEVGRALGRWGARACHRHLIESPAWASVMQWRGHPRVAAMRAQVHHVFPWIEFELRGMAEGLGLSYEDVFLWNCRGDLWSMAPDGCTTVLGPQRLTHNEDGDPGFTGQCAMAEIRLIDAPAFVSFVYPGSLPGHTFAVNQTGLAMTVNNIRATGTPAPGIPRMVLTRALLPLERPRQAIALLESHPRAGAFHLGLGKAGDRPVHSVEFSHTAVSSVIIDRAAHIHANHAIHEAQASLHQIITPSSAHRQQRGEALLGEDRDPLDILADDQDPAEPIYRQSPHDTDHENTLATVDIDLQGERPLWAVYAQRGILQYRFDGLHRLEG